jgi:hypothetical protein
MSNYRFVTRAFPDDYWARHGEEILETANEIHDDEWSARESRDLLTNGLRTRSLGATQGTASELWTQSAALFVFITLLGGVSAAMASRLGLGNARLLGFSLPLELIGIASLLALTRSTASAAIFGLGNAAAFSVPLFNGWTQIEIELALALGLTVVLSAGAIWLATPGNRRLRSAA